MAFDPSQCSGAITYNGQSNRCAVISRYLDGSTTGTVATVDQLSMGSWSGSTTFGAAYTLSDDFLVPGTDGIWGMSRPNPGWIFLQNGPLNTLVAAGMPAQFAMCMTTSGGDLHLGGYDNSYASSGINWFRFNSSSSHYDISVSGWSVGSTNIANSAASVTVDSGSTLTHVPHAVYEAIRAAVQDQCPTCPNVWDGVATVLTPNSFPSITLSLQDSAGTARTITLTGSQWLYSQNGNNQYQAGFTDEFGDEWIFGQSMMRNWYTVFDMGYGVVGIGNIASGKCTAALSPAAPLTSITPSTEKPPTSTGGLTPVANAPAPRAPLAATPNTQATPVSSPSTPSAPTSGPTGGGGSPTNTNEPNSASQLGLIAPLLIVVASLMAIIF